MYRQISPIFVAFCICTFVPFAVKSQDLAPSALPGNGTVEVGDFCFSNADCAALGPLATCTEDLFCICRPESSVPSHDLRQCLPILNFIGSQCQEDLQCMMGAPGNLSICSNNTKRCECADGAIRERGRHVCYKQAEFIGESCQINLQCTSGLDEFSRCTGGICDCISPAFASETNERCLPVVNFIGQSCEESHQCELGTPGRYSDCINNTCRCTREAINERGRHQCLKRATFVGEQCTVTDQCRNLGDLAVCSSRTCLCAGNSIVVNGGRRCLARVDFLGGECSQDIQCQRGTPGGLSRCLGETGNRTCGCPEGSVRVPGEHLCYKAATFVGETCNRQEQCLQNLGLAVCSSSRCNCASSAIPTLDNRRCIPIVNQLDNSCTENRQCQRGQPGALSHCANNGTCACNPLAINAPGENRCLQIATQVGESCSNNVQCQPVLGNTCTCRSSRCSCP